MPVPQKRKIKDDLEALVLTAAAGEDVEHLLSDILSDRTDPPKKACQKPRVVHAANIVRLRYKDAVRL